MVDFSFGGAMDLLKGGKDTFDKAGGVGGLTEKWDKANNSDAVVNTKSILKMNNYLGKIESELKDNVKADDINISATEKSDLAGFIQNGLAKMGHNITADGFAGVGTVAALNTALMDKVESIGWNNFDKLKDVTEIADISELSGRHVQVFVDELRNRDILEGDSTELLQELGQALREIDNDKLQGYADKIDPKVEIAPAAVDAVLQAAPTAP